jgi:anti-sigma regulatory factor (Ser/Thr protein kinase)
MARVTGLPEVGPRDHVVQFYGADDELAVTAGGYLAEGIRSGDGVLVVATAPHRLVFAAALARAGIDLARERDAGRLLMEDAAELLDRFLVGGVLDRERFHAVASGLILRTAAGGRPVRVYAEMVAVLWDAGQVGLAVELEELWNGLGARLPFALLCAYPSRLMTGPETADAVRQVCLLHSAVSAGEPVSAAEPDSAAELDSAVEPGDAGPAVRERSFPLELDSVRAARHFVTGLFNEGPDDALASDAAIVATELAANAVLHARSAFTVTVSRSAAAVRIAVRDGDPLVHGNGRVPFDVRLGHGLSVVSQLASGWAVERLPAGKVVWADLTAKP